MSARPVSSKSSKKPDGDFPLSGADGTEKRRGVIHDRKFRVAWVASTVLHLALFGWASLAPSETKYRFFGSGTAVSLVGADEIPGGSARGKSGDRLEDPAKSARKIKTSKKPTKPGEKVRRIKTGNARKKKAAKKRDPRREARLKRILERRERARKWRKRFQKNERLAKADTVPKNKAPLKGYVGEGGGDGQGGGSLGGGSGGAARTAVERYYGLLSDRIRGYWTIPLSLSGVGKLNTTVTIDVSRTGDYRNLQIERSSGNPIYDQAVLRAMERAFQSAPRPPNSMKENWILLGFRFCGRDFCE